MHPLILTSMVFLAAAALYVRLPSSSILSTQTNPPPPNDSTAAHPAAAIEHNYRVMRPAHYYDDEGDYEPRAAGPRYRLRAPHHAPPLPPVCRDDARCRAGCLLKIAPAECVECPGCGYLREVS
ncbi:hypothetical protein F4780DRAFT_776836 [Xylariomycetidae sp. FL0641]|nr:hypothetical protein F4780DRAFT_776836 [Xylariomycetidae sp. FL0641]